jgi:hypothetical protein
VLLPSAVLRPALDLAVAARVVFAVFSDCGYL